MKCLLPLLLVLLCLPASAGPCINTGCAKGLTPIGWRCVGGCSAGPGSNFTCNCKPHGTLGANTGVCYCHGLLPGAPFWVRLLSY